LFSDQYKTINDFIVINSSHSLRHVSAGNYGHHWVVLQLYKMEKLYAFCDVYSKHFMLAGQNV